MILLQKKITTNTRIELNQLSMGWVDPWVGLGWVQQLSLRGGAFVLACWAAAEDILNIHLKSLFLSDIMTHT